jgi:hypothetical protein
MAQITPSFSVTKHDYVGKVPYSDLEEEFELYKSLQARGVRDEIYQELLAQELDRREQQEYDYE